MSLTIADNIANVREQIANSCVRAGRDPESVLLIAVSKTHPTERVVEAIAAGVQHFGENRVEESASKIPAVNDLTDKPVVWHMIGHIQSRKAKEILPLFQVVHSVDTLKLAEKFSRLMVEQGGLLAVLLEVNVSGEESKAGFQAYGWETDQELRRQLIQQVTSIRALPGLSLRGLMTMAPIVEVPEETRLVFASLAGLRDMLRQEIGIPLSELSMGMTDDYPVAIEEGATMIRVGRAIFGERTG